MDMNQESEMSLVGHLTELRTRIIICLVALIFSVVGCFFVAKPILSVLTAPIDRMQQEPGRDNVLQLVRSNTDGTLRISDPRLAKAGLDSFSQKRLEIILPADPARNLTTHTLNFGGKASQSLYYSKPMDPFMMLLKVALIAGIIIALPILLWQSWMFVKPGLKPKEQKIIKPMLGGAVILFPLGASFAYFMISLVLKVMQAYAVDNVNPLLNVFDYFSLLFNLMLIFGFIFEVPLALAIASRIGLVTPAFLKTYRRHAYVVLAFAAMVISPGGDPFSMIAALGPLVALYEISIAISIPMARLHKQDLDAEGSEDEDEENENPWSNDDDSETEITPDTTVSDGDGEQENRGYYDYPENTESDDYPEDGNAEDGKTEEEAENAETEESPEEAETEGTPAEESNEEQAVTPEAAPETAESEEKKDDSQPRYWWPDANPGQTSESETKPEEPKP